MPPPRDDPPRPLLRLRRPALRTVFLLLLVWPLAWACATGASRLRPEEALALRHVASTGIPPQMPLDPATVERLLRDPGFTIEKVEEIDHGVTNPKRLTLRFPGLDEPVDFKWKPAPAEDPDGWNNTPRRELAAYAIQKWFLDPAEYVVPPTAAVCIPLDVYAPVDPHARANIPTASCVFGILALWLEDVQIPSVMLDRQRFVREPLYARHLAQLNLLTYLIEHRDGRASNFLVSEEGDEPRFFSVDNGLSFGVDLYNFFILHWDGIRVPGVPDDAIRRLWEVGPARFQQLGVVAQYQVEEDGRVRAVGPGPNLDAQRGTRRVGHTLQLGLTEEEIEDVADRLEDLLDHTSEGELPVF